jgi:hypothetical protein
MAHRGLQEFTSQEISNAALGQNGFHILEGSMVTGGAFTIGADETIVGPDGSVGHTGKNDGVYWIALKAIHTTSNVSARSYGAGDDLSQSGVYASGTQLDMSSGDIVYGSFDAVTVDSGDFIIAYIGK